jgi:surfactin synthase thioesterase subunit
MIAQGGTDRQTGGSPAGPWVVNEGHAEKASASWQLFCFSHAGGGPSFFRSWGTWMRPEIAVRRVLLPGREWRLEERPFRHIADLLDPLCDALESHLAQPYAFFGHSMGAVVAYEVARRFSATGTRGPACLIVSGRGAPGLTGNHRRLSALPDDAFVSEVGRLNGIPPEVLSEPQLLSMLLPTLRADYELAETYQPLPGSPLGCPVVAYMSTSDTEVQYTEMLAWRKVTTSEFSIRVFRGDHFYLKGGRPDVLNAIRDDLGLVLQQHPEILRTSHTGRMDKPPVSP